ncbi:hypothetical protein ACQP2T_47725 [Nonomuraea sp. CA-143628]|uniref:hypothetical protein n=1 Tax=Nonomuraea sp. CA-143628 TaxID=3239997 RepID=UPI003D8A5FFE
MMNNDGERIGAARPGQAASGLDAIEAEHATADLDAVKAGHADVEQAHVATRLNGLLKVVRH